MLLSHSNPGSFRLQPAPRTRPKKVVQARNDASAHSQNGNLPDSSNATRIALRPSQQNQGSVREESALRSCFEEEEDDEEDVETPKVAAHFWQPESFRESVDRCIHLATSTSSSVEIPFSSSPSPRTPAAKRSTPQTARPPSDTVTVLLTNKSPTPSSPLFPRRTLFRSLSSTCLHAARIAPPPPVTSPSHPSPHPAPNKSLGWRGSVSAKLHDDTSIDISPGSPITPNTWQSLHTPTQSSISSLLQHHPLYQPHEPVSIVEIPKDDDLADGSEPLSATLKALGAKRHSEKFPRPSSPASASPTAAAGPIRSSTTSQRCPLIDRDPEVVEMPFQASAGTRRIFHLPTWIRFEAHHHARSQLGQDVHRPAPTDLSQHEASLPNEASEGIATTTNGRTVSSGDARPGLPRTSCLGDAAPDSPNGELFGGFDVVEVKEGVAEARAASGQPNSMQAEAVQVHVVRRPPMAALRSATCSSDHSSKGAPGVRVAAILGAIRGVVPSSSRKDFWVRQGGEPGEPFPAVGGPGIYPHVAARDALGVSSCPLTEASVADRRDGWGGVLTRSSWFPNLDKGPLVSPASAARPDHVDPHPTLSRGIRNGLKTLLLRRSPTQRRHIPPHPSTTSQPQQPRPTTASPGAEEEEWEDFEPVLYPNGEARLATPVEDKSFLELERSPRFPVHAPRERGEGGRWWWRFRIPSRRQADADGEKHFESLAGYVPRSVPSPCSTGFAKGRDADAVECRTVAAGAGWIENRPTPPGRRIQPSTLR